MTKKEIAQRCYEVMKQHGMLESYAEEQQREEADKVIGGLPLCSW